MASAVTHNMQLESTIINHLGDLSSDSDKAVQNTRYILKKGLVQTCRMMNNVISTMDKPLQNLNEGYTSMVKMEKTCEG